ncbi:MAG: hypothetical protein F6K26_50610 [Moorea sp. SIO2I5]|nr:hypothetical protein [Moorena sp. SIO2I5]
MYMLIPFWPAIAQWVVLRRYISDAWVWVVVTSLGIYGAIPTIVFVYFWLGPQQTLLGNPIRLPMTWTASIFATLIGCVVLSLFQSVAFCHGFADFGYDFAPLAPQTWGEQNSQSPPSLGDLGGLAKTKQSRIHTSIKQRLCHHATRLGWWIVLNSLVWTAFYSWIMEIFYHYYVNIFKNYNERSGYDYNITQEMAVKLIILIIPIASFIQGRILVWLFNSPKESR